MSSALAVRGSGAELMDPGAMVGLALQRLEVIQRIKREAMEEGVHFGTIPGTDKPSLWKPGAEILCIVFDLSSPVEELEIIELPGGHREVRSLVHCIDSAGRIRSRRWATCSTMEPKYRYRKVGRVCPACGAATIRKGNKEYGGGWYCSQKDGGCGAKYKENDPAILGQETGKAEHQDPAEYWHTISAMSQKRAEVGAVRTATGSSAIFHDYRLPEEGGFENDEEPKKAKPPVQQPKAKEPKEARGEIAEGFFTPLEVKTGTSKTGKPWTLHRWKSEKGHTFSTFSETVAAEVEARVGEGGPARISYERREGSGGAVELVITGAA